MRCSVFRFPMAYLNGFTLVNKKTFTLKKLIYSNLFVPASEKLKTLRHSLSSFYKNKTKTVGLP